jgi:hypothetical protein
MTMASVTLPAHYYQQFDADFNQEIPAEAFHGWKKAPVEISLEHTAVVVMHAWDVGTRAQYPGWHRTVEFFSRSTEICRNVFPPLLNAIRSSGFQLFHVAVKGDYLQKYPGYQKAMKLAGPSPAPPETIETDPFLEKLKEFKEKNAGAGTHNLADIAKGFKKLDFPIEAKPKDHEGIAEDAHQLFALCKAAKVNHLIYAGFAINWCLFHSPGGMNDMRKRGLMCSAFRQAVTAVENKESAKAEWGKELALWRVAILHGFVFDVDDFIQAILRK